MISFSESFIVSIGALGGTASKIDKKTGKRLQLLQDKIAKHRGGWETQHGHPLNKAMGFGESYEDKPEYKEMSVEKRGLWHDAHAKEMYPSLKAAREAGDHAAAHATATDIATHHRLANGLLHKASKMEIDDKKSRGLKAVALKNKDAAKSHETIASEHKSKIAAAPKTPETPRKAIPAAPRQHVSKNLLRSVPKSIRIKPGQLPKIRRHLQYFSVRNRNWKPHPAAESVESLGEAFVPAHPHTASLFANLMCALLKRKMANNAPGIEIANQAAITAKAHENAFALNQMKADRTPGDEHEFYINNAQEHNDKAGRAQLVASEFARKHAVDYDTVDTYAVNNYNNKGRFESVDWAKRVSLLENIEVELDENAAAREVGKNGRYYAKRADAVKDARGPKYAKLAGKNLRDAATKNQVASMAATSPSKKNRYLKLAGAYDAKAKKFESSDTQDCIGGNSCACEGCEAEKIVNSSKKSMKSNMESIAFAMRFVGLTED